MDVKSANRIATPRTEGIYRVADMLTARITCIVCGRTLSSAVFPRSAHAKKHVREGKAFARTEYSHDGPRVVYELAAWECECGRKNSPNFLTCLCGQRRDTEPARRSEEPK